MAKQWVNEHPNTRMKAGDFYRCNWLVTSPFPNETLQSMVRKAINAAGKVGVNFTVKEVNFYSPNELVYISRHPVWELEVIWQDHDQAEEIVVAGIIVGAIGVLFLGWSIVRGQMQHLVETTGQEANKLADKLTSPGLVIAGLIIGVLTLAKR